MMETSSEALLGASPQMRATDWPSVPAVDQTPNQRSAFEIFYPNGLPKEYKMQLEADSDQVPTIYVEDNLPVGFYTTTPSWAKAVFSTLDGKRELRHLQHVLPARHVHLWSKDEVQSTCNSIRKVWWKLMKNMPKPTSWDDLWLWFDSHDIYHYGATNLWNVLNNLYDENQTILVDFQQDIVLLVGNWADEWVAKDENKARLCDWNETQGPLLKMLNSEDREELGDLEDDMYPLVERALQFRRNLSGDDSRPSAPKDLMTVYHDNNIHNWLGMYISHMPHETKSKSNFHLIADEPSFSPSGLPQPPFSGPPTSPHNYMAAPCVMHNGRLYYDAQAAWEHSVPNPVSVPTNSGAVQALQRSAAAAETTRQNGASLQSGPVIAMGSYRKPHGWVPLNQAAAPPSFAIEPAQLKQVSPVAVSTGSPSPKIDFTADVKTDFKRRKSDSAARPFTGSLFDSIQQTHSPLDSVPDFGELSSKTAGQEVAKGAVPLSSHLPSPRPQRPA